MCGSPQASRVRLNGICAAGTLLTIVSLASVVQSSAELAFQALYTFPNSNPYPWGVSAKLIEDDDGDFYGTSIVGGSNNFGTVFRISTAGSLTTLFSFNGTNGHWPFGGLTRGNDGDFYGVTTYGGDGFVGPAFTTGKGTIFRITTNGDLTTLVYFNGTNGINPIGLLTLGSDGSFYGTTMSGGSGYNGIESRGAGTIFKVTSTGELTTLTSFGPPANDQTQATLIRGNDELFYGTTFEGGDNDNGTIFKITPNGALTTLFSFGGTNGSGPGANLTLASDGNFYGTTSYGGRDYIGAGSGNGTIFKVRTNGEFSTLLFFNGTNGSQSFGSLAQGNDGYFYGTTTLGGSNNYGTLFRISTNGALATLVHFDGTNGVRPVGSMVLGRDGNLYGTLADVYYNRHPNGDRIFRLVEPPVLTAITLTNGTVNLSWNSFTNGVYQVEYKPSLTAADWMVTFPALTATGSITRFMDSSEVAAERYYRVVLRQ